MELLSKTLIISESTFRKLIEKFKIFGDAHQDTDMCGYCVRGVELKKVIKPLWVEHEEHELGCLVSAEYLDDDDVDMRVHGVESVYEGIPKLQDGDNTDKYIYPLQQLMNYIYISENYDSTDESIWTDRLTDFYTIMNHRYDKKMANEQCKKDCEHPPDRTIVFVADFKQNMIIGRSQVEVSEAYRQSREPRSVLGFHVVTQSARCFVDYVSDCTSKSSAYAVQCMKHLLNSQWINLLIAQQNICNVILWTDRGTHFMDKHNVYYWLCELLWKKHGIHC